MRMSLLYRFGGWVIGPIASVVYLIATNAKQSVIPGIHPAIEAGALLIFIIVVAEKIAAEIRVGELDVKLAALSVRPPILIGANTPTEVIGDDQNASKYVLTRLKGAEEISNTFITTLTPERQRAIFGTDSTELIVSGVIDHLRQGKTWNDIVSSQGLDRVQTISKRIKAEGIERRNYRACVLNGNCPTLNFIILTFANGNKEVYFGWGFHEEMAVGNVFRSKAPEIVQYFDKYFVALRAKSKEVLE